MCSRHELSRWIKALDLYDRGDLVDAAQTFSLIAFTSRIWFNLGLIHASMADHEAAVAYFQHAVYRDRYLSVGYFQLGVSNFLLGEFKEAAANFNDALRNLRGNAVIDYRQLGLSYRLYACEVLFNRGLCNLYMDNDALGMEDLVRATKEKVLQSHDVIDEAIEDEGHGYTVFSIPHGILYRPVSMEATSTVEDGLKGRSQSLRRKPSRKVVTVKRPNLVSSNSLSGKSYGAENLVWPDVNSSIPQHVEEIPILLLASDVDVDAFKHVNTSRAAGSRAVSEKVKKKAEALISKDPIEADHDSRFQITSAETTTGSSEKVLPPELVQTVQEQTTPTKKAVPSQLGIARRRTLKDAVRSATKNFRSPKKKATNESGR